MRVRRLGQCWWVMRLVHRHALHQAGLHLGSLAARLLPLPLQHRTAQWAFATLGPLLHRARRRRTMTALQRLGLPRHAAARLSTAFLAHAWLRRGRLRHLQALPFPALKHHLRSIAWQDPLALWPAGAGRRRVICVLPTGDLEAAIAALLDRPGAPAHYFINCPHAACSPQYRTLMALQRQSHRLDIGSRAQPGLGWRLLKRGATVVTVLDPVLMASAVSREGRWPAPLRLARAARVPVLLVGHRHDNGSAGTLHVLGEFSLHPDVPGFAALCDAVHGFLAGSPLDWADLDGWAEAR
ncbi:hypothetical protein ARC23_05190 [Stenotrophomonas beteli]|uniref:Uncharacterized protein n=2 Tax=Stenotrophomonas beteli TaxID=3384461 RepID=A0A0R0BF21_9GAMM|nr:hypothetical protein ARC23_05190 [Stenotrophomonas maltophilia]